MNKNTMAALMGTARNAQKNSKKIRKKLQKESPLQLGVENTETKFVTFLFLFDAPFFGWR